MRVKINHTNLDGSVFEDNIDVDGELSQPELDKTVLEWLHDHCPEWVSAFVNFYHPSYTLMYTTTRMQ